VHEAQRGTLVALVDDVVALKDCASSYFKTHSESVHVRKRSLLPRRRQGSFISAWVEATYRDSLIQANS
jgi:hypothetical protein